MTQVKNSGGYSKSLQPMMSRLDAYLSDYEDIFKSATKRFHDKAKVYCQGIFMSALCNIERISEEMSANYHQMQHFISESPWEHRKLIDRVALDVSHTLPKRKLTGLIIDESGWVKKGGKSVGVAPQYCGNVGKVANSQVAVFGALSNGDFASMVDARLFLPQSWCDNTARMEEAGIPQEEQEFKMKWKIGLDMIRHQQSLGVSFDYVGADGYYGNSIEFAEAIEDMCYVYMLDIHSNLTIYLEKSEIGIPPAKSKRGRKPSKEQPLTKGIGADKYMSELSESQWQHLVVRNTAKGKLKGDYHFRTVYIWDEDKHRMLRRLLVIRRTVDEKGEYEYKYSFSNANLDQYTEKGIAYMQAQRFFVEHCIKENKQVLGMDQYQTRLWPAWQHQIALNLLLSAFILKEKLLCFKDLPLLSAYDIKRWIVFKLYKKMTDDDMINQIFERHCRRQRDINVAFDKQILMC
ncbi:MAG: IS701 family transposase [Fibromonadaceae bacterium]|nr:IS701 family transposase [Fibromonadaceae bacterium]